MKTSSIFYHINKHTVAINEAANANEHQHSNNQVNHKGQQYDYEEEKKLWTKPSEFKPNPGQNEALEEFLFDLESYLFNPDDIRKVKDNLTKEERECLKQLSKWNKDANCTRMFRIQDKGSRFVVEPKEKYEENMPAYLENKSIFREDQQEVSRENDKRVNE